MWNALKAAVCDPQNAPNLVGKYRHEWLADNVKVGDQKLGDLVTVNQIKTKLHNEKSKGGNDAADLQIAYDCTFPTLNKHA